MIAERKHEITRERRLLAVLLILILVGAVGNCAYVYRFNHVHRQYDAGEVNGDFVLSIERRTGMTDSWVKNVGEDGVVTAYYGTIYDVTLDNIGKHSISQWTMKMDIPSDCFLNNAWCGTVDVHQNTPRGEAVQNIDLRNFEQTKLEVDYRIMDPDLMIPLSKGDWLCYRPDAAAKEYPLCCNDEGEITQVVFGMIFYSNDPVPVEFTSYHVEYCLEQSFTHS